MDTVLDNLQKVKERIKEAASRVERDVRKIKLVAVSKNVEIPAILSAIQAGVKIIGERTVQEAKLKYPHLKNQVEYHLVGHLQRNKVKDAVGMFSLIHSVDNFELAKEIDKRAGQINKVQDILIEVNTSGEATKFGIVPSEVDELLAEIKILPNIRVQGLMTVAPFVDYAEKARPYFRMLKEINERFGLKYLSMGMSNDFEVAIEEGANMVRIGRAIFSDEFC